MCVCGVFTELCNPFIFALIFFVHLILPSHKASSCVGFFLIFIGAELVYKVALFSAI